jgi:hypothetical protein
VADLVSELPFARDRRRRGGRYQCAAEGGLPAALHARGLQHAAEGGAQSRPGRVRGQLTAKKWAALAKVSIPTAQRDINDLVERGILRRNPGGSKNTSYDLAEL